MSLTWRDADEIGYQLFEEFPDLDPLKIGFQDLHSRVVALDEFEDDPKKSSEGSLEAIQMAWYEEFQDA